jgi:hypothetical protein
MVGLFRAINSDQLSSGNRELFHYSRISQKEIEKFLVRFAQKDTHVATAASAVRPWAKPWALEGKTVKRAKFASTVEPPR